MAPKFIRADSSLLNYVTEADVWWIGGLVANYSSTSFLNAMRSAIVHRIIFLDVHCVSEAAVYREFRNSFSGKLLRNSTSLVRGMNGLYLSQNDEFHRQHHAPLFAKVAS